MSTVSSYGRQLVFRQWWFVMGRNKSRFGVSGVGWRSRRLMTIGICICIPFLIANYFRSYYVVFLSPIFQNCCIPAPPSINQNGALHRRPNGWVFHIHTIVLDHSLRRDILSLTVHLPARILAARNIILLFHFLCTRSIL